MVKSIWTNIRDGEDGNDLGRRKLNLQDLLPSAPLSRVGCNLGLKVESGSRLHSCVREMNDPRRFRNFRVHHLP